MFALPRSVTARMSLPLPSLEVAITVTVYDHGTYYTTQPPFTTYFTGTNVFLAANSSFTGTFLNETVAQSSVLNASPPVVIRQYEVHPWSPNSNVSAVAIARAAMSDQNPEKGFYYMVRSWQAGTNKAQYCNGGSGAIGGTHGFKSCA